MTTEKFGPGVAERWTEDEYADPLRYLGHRAELVRSLGPLLQRGDRVLDLACGDGALGTYLLSLDLSYTGVDASEAMVAAARARLGTGAEIQLGDIDGYRPPAPVAATTVFRAVYYARDRAAFFQRVAAFTEKKLVFDLNPRRYPLAAVRAELDAAGFDRLDLHPFFVPQHVALPGPLQRLLLAAEDLRPLAAALLRLRFSYLCAASRSGAGSEERAVEDLEPFD
jgi:SAM-dependent methyltransferase